MMIGFPLTRSPHVSISNSSNSTINNNDKIKKENTLTKNTSGNSLQKNNPLKSLMEQKQKIADSRQKYLDNALSKNEDPKAIKDKLAEYDKQMAEIDKQINELKLEEQKKKTGIDDKEKTKEKNTSNNSNSKTDMSSQMMDKLVSLSNNISQVKTISKEKNHENGEKRVLETEIKLDESRRVDPRAKKKRVAQIDKNLTKLDEIIGEELKSTNSENSINNVVNKTENSDYSKEKGNEKNIGKTVQKQKILKAIKNYKDNIENETQTNDTKLNLIA